MCGGCPFCGYKERERVPYEGQLVWVQYEAARSAACVGAAVAARSAACVGAAQAARSAACVGAAVVGVYHNTVESTTALDLCSPH